MKKVKNFIDIRKKIGVASEISCALLCFLGVLLSLLNYSQDGYSHWSKRLLYFTAQSNIWLGVLCLFSFFYRIRNGTKHETIIFYIKYVFVVSIAMTGVVFCSLLGPFADASYNAWSLSGIITHIFTPILGILTLFFNPFTTKIEKKHCFISMLPPLLYFSTVILLSFFNFDFGRGENFVYFFLNFNSLTSSFGFNLSASQGLFGSFYWLVLLFFLMLSIAFILRHAYNKSTPQ